MSVLRTKPLQRFELVEDVICQLRLTPGQARPRRCSLSTTVLAGEQSIRQGEIRQHANSAIHAGRYEFLFRVTFQEVVVILRRHEPSLMLGLSNPIGIGDLPS